MIISIYNYSFFLKILHRLSLKSRRFRRYLPMSWLSKKNMGGAWSKERLSNELTRTLGTFDEAIRESDEISKNNIITGAEEAHKHKFKVLGSSGVELNPIVWNCDIKTGFVWPNGKFYLDYIIVDPNNNADVKVPWELSRCHHLLWLGEAYIMTENEEYAKEIINEISDWIDSNKFMHSINWTCAMDVAIRAVNWMYALCMIRNSDVFTNQFAGKVSESLYQHGFYIFNNLEKGFPYSHNHYDSDLAGLVYLGLLFNKTKRGKQWLGYATTELFQEIRLQVFPSGAQYERSISYHRLVTELFSYSFYALQRNHYFIPKDILCRLKSMFSFVEAYLPTNGLAPTIEDNDDGRFLPFVPRNLRCHSYLTNPKSLENQIASIGCPSVYDKQERSSSHLFCDVGFAIMRKGAAYVCLANGGQSKFETFEKTVGSHTHNDLLSFVLSLGDDDVIVDPGTYVYTADCKQRNFFRSTGKHNTVVVDDEEQNILPAKDMFIIEKNARIGGLHLSETEESVQSWGDYLTLQGKMHHTRKLELTTNQLVVDDVIEKADTNHTIRLCYHLSASAKNLTVVENRVLFETPHFEIEIIIDGFPQGTISVVDDVISPSYGVLVNTKMIVAKWLFDNQVNVKCLIKWSKKNIYESCNCCIQDLSFHISESNSGNRVGQATG